MTARHLLASFGITASIVCLAPQANRPVHAAELPMINIQSSYPKGYVGKLSAVTDETREGRETREGNVASFIFSDSRGTRLTYTTDELRKGVVILRAFGKDIIRVYSPDFTASEGGVIQVIFLRKFFGSDRRQVEFDYLPVGQDWVVRTRDPAGRDPFDSLTTQIAMSLGIPQSVEAVDLKQDAVLVRHLDPSKLPRAGRTGRRARR